MPIGRRRHVRGNHLSASSARSFDDLVDEATSVSLEGWDFSFLRGRVTTEPLPWSYEHLAARLISSARRVLDVDTGGGETFSSLRPPPGSVATEPHQPNIAVAARRLEPLGVHVVARTTDTLPAEDGTFDLVLNRHGWLDARETFRVLTPDGRLLSQQVGAHNDLELNQALGIPVTVDPTVPAAPIDLVDDLKHAGFAAPTVREAVVVTRFLDIGAVVFQLRAVPWQAPGFNVLRHRQHLKRIHDEIARTGGFTVRSQRFLIEAQKPA
jgi:SAM-dependent methyltransferase